MLDEADAEDAEGDAGELGEDDAEGAGGGGEAELGEDGLGVGHGDVDAREVDGGHREDGDEEGPAKVRHPEDGPQPQLPAWPTQPVLLLELFQHLPIDRTIS